MRQVKRLLLIGTESHYGQGVTEGIHSYCRAHGRWDYHLEPDNSPESARRAEFAIRKWKADGIVACVQSQRIVDVIHDSGLPTVNVTGFSHAALPSVWTDFKVMGQMIARHFLRNGFRHFGFCVKTGEPQAMMKCESFVGTLRKAGFACDVLIEDYHGFSEQDWVANDLRRNQWLQMLKKPVAIMCTYDYLSRCIAGDCERLGLRVPEDVAIVGTQNQVNLCQMCNTPLSSVELSTRQIGYEAARLVDRLMRGGKPPARPILVPPGRLVIRQSSDIVAIEDPGIAAVVRYIRENAFEPISIKDVLRAVPISRRIMEQRFRQLMGRTPKSEITRLRLERATQLLESTELAIPMIAQQSGFIGPETFAITFHRCLGVSPSVYRRNFRTTGAAYRVDGKVQKTGHRKLAIKRG